MRVLTILLLAGAVAWGQEDAEVKTLWARFARGDDATAYAAADRLAELGPAAKDAVELLTGALRWRDPELRWRAAWVLSRIGPDAAAAAPELVRTYDEDKSALVIAAAEIAIRRIGAAAEEPLLQSIAKTKGGDRADRLELLGKIGPSPQGIDVLAKLIGSPDEIESHGAANAIQEIGAPARVAIPALIEALRGKGRWKFYYEDALVAIGEPSVEPVVRLFHNGNEAVKSSALKLLVRLGEYERVEKILGGKPPANVTGALWGIAEVGPASAVLLPTVEKAIRETNPTSAVRALYSLGNDGGAALIRLLKASNEETRISLIHQIASLIRDHEPGWTEARRDELFPVILRMLDSKSQEQRVAALGAMQLMEFDRLQSPKVARVAVKRLKEDDVEIRVAAARLAGGLGRGAKPALRALRKARVDDLHSIDLVRIAATGALCRLGAGGRKEVDLLLEFRKSDDEKLRLAALRALVDAGPLAKSAYPKLLEIIQQKEWRPDRDLAAEALGAMMPGLGTDRTTVLATVTGLKGGHGHDVQLAFLRGLVRSSDAETMLLLQNRTNAGFLPADLLPERVFRIGTRARKSLKNGLKHRDPDVRRFAAAVLVRMAPDEATDEELISALHHDWIVFFEFRIELLKAYRSIPNRAVPLMIGALKHESVATRAGAAHVLENLGAAARPAVPALHAVAKSDPNVRVRRRALSAMDRILAAE